MQRARMVEIIQTSCLGPSCKARLTVTLAGAFTLGIASVCPNTSYAQQASPPEQTGTPGNPAVAPADKPYVAPASFSEWASSIKLGLQG